MCYDCYVSLQASFGDAEKKMQDLLTFLKEEIFNTNDVKAEAIDAINRAINKDGRTINGIKLTIEYYYKILGNTPNDQSMIGWVIRNNYDNAKKYYTEQIQIKKNNEKVDLNIAPIHVRINPEKLHKDNKKDKITYNMEDL